MLVLSRQEGEKIVIGDQIVITVVEIRKGLVRLGFDAPRSIPIHREEIYKAIKASDEHKDLPDSETTPRSEPC